MAGRAESARQSVLTFEVGGQRFAAPANSIAEVLRPPALTRVPHAPRSLVGLSYIRGSVVPVVSLARLLDRPAAAATAAARCLLLETDDPIALAVDAVGTLDTVATSDVIAGGHVLIESERGAQVIDLLSLVRQDFAARHGSDAPRVTPAPPVAPAAAVPTAALLTFELSGQDYALAVDEVLEVLKLPADIVAVPQSDAVVVGVVPHRNGLLPLVSLHALLGLDRGPADAGYVIVLGTGAARIGFIADRLVAISRVPMDAIEPTPAVLNRGAGEAHIRSLARLPDGRGVLSILTGDRLFRDATVAGLRAQTATEVAEMTPDAANEKVVVFRLGTEAYGIPIAAVEEVVRLPERLTRVPKAPAFVEGVMNLRGRAVPVIDQGTRFDASGEAAAGRRRVIIATIDGQPVGFAVDAVSEILELPSDAFAPSPALAGGDARLFEHVAQLPDGRMILVVNPRELLDRAERDLLAELAAAAGTQAAG